MPIYHIQYQGQAQAADGSQLNIPPQQVLMLRGPVVQVTVTVHPSIAQQLLQQGQSVPDPIPGLALIDTGASATCIDEELAKQLALPVVDTVQMASASHASVQQNIYPAVAAIIGSPITLSIPRAIGAALATQGLSLLIGRDILKDCTLHYNGVTGQITLSM